MRVIDDMVKKDLFGKLKIALNVLFLGIGILLFYFVIHISGKSFFTLLKKSTNVRYYYVLAAFAVSYIGFVLNVKRWKLLMSCYTDVKSLPKGFIFYNTGLGLLIGSFLPIFGYIGTKAVSCKLEHNISAPKTVYATSIEYLIGGTVVISMLVPSILYTLNILSVSSGIIGIVIITIGLIVGFSPYYRITLNTLGSFFSYVVLKLNRISFLKRKINKDLFNPNGFSSIDKRTSTKLVCLTLLMYYTVFIRYFIYLKAFNIHVNALEFVLLFSIGYALSSLGITPGNLGIAELGWFGVLSIVGTSNDSAALYAVGQRIINLGVMILLSVMSYIYYLTCKYKDRALRINE